ncbi:MAG TPA: hypothetical protein VFJ88_09545 [Chthoniobacterales bacterium]|jgi:hypothetical protein|nr:hypothetical protein [Chthoniobacterales bacterium]
MKFFLSLGGSLGFLGAFFSALHGGNGVGFAIRDGAIGCLVGAFLLRGFHWVIIFSIKSLAQEQSEESAVPGSAPLSGNGTN